MAEMSVFEKVFCRSVPWRAFTGRVVLPWALQGLRPEGEGLEIGAGSGAMAFELLSSFPILRMTVTDYDEEMLDRAKRILAPFSDRVTIQQADATKLPFEEGSYDAVFSFIMLHHVMAWEDALREAVRVLRPGGRLVGYDILANGIVRALHQVEGSPHRLVVMGRLKSLMEQLSLTDVSLRAGLAGLVVRFSPARTA